MLSGAALMLVALAVEASLGWPDRLFALVRHPVVWIGSLIAALDALLNRENDAPARRQAAGALTTLTVVAACTVVAWLVSRLLPDTLAGTLVEGVIASSLLASRSLYKHVQAVSAPLAAGDIDTARKALSRIVGRDTRVLDEAGIARATLESLAENASDGVIAPLFFGMLFGLPGLAAYKAINTLDSMIGHRSARYRDFGRFAARLDDLANLVPARLSAMLLWIVGGCRGSPSALAREARPHRSVNAGWPESAMAFALGVRLSGPRRYGEHVHDEPWLNGAARDPHSADLARGVRLFIRSVRACAGLLVVASLIT